MEFVSIVALVGIVVIVASLLSSVIDRTGIPLVAVFIGLGALLGPHVLGVVDIGFGSPQLRTLSILALALVLFSDAVTLDTKLLHSRWRLILRLLGPGTLLPAAIVAVAAKLLLDVPAWAAAILGAALASTDPVLLRSVMRSRALPDTPRIALRIETGMNDIVLLPIVVIAVIAMTGMAPHAAAHAEAKPDVIRNLAGLFVLGPVLGAAVGWGGIRALEFVRSRLGLRRDYESLYALGLAFTAYAAAEAVGGSGFVAAFAAGLLVAVQDVELCDCFLEYGEATAEMLLLLTFVALGTTLIWTGLEHLNLRTLAFAAIALGARTVVLHPMLGGLGLAAHDRRLISLLGPRGLSSLLLALLPVFAGIEGAERWFSITCLVVLISVVLHGGGIALYLRSHARKVAAPIPAVGQEEAGETCELRPEDQTDLRITLDEYQQLRFGGENIVLAESRKHLDAPDERMATGAVRVRPDDPVGDATASRIPKTATIVVYCA